MTKTVDKLAEAMRDLIETCGGGGPVTKRAREALAEWESGKAQPSVPDDHIDEGKPGQLYCLACEKIGHRTTDCHSTHGLNTARELEMQRLCLATQPAAPSVPDGMVLVRIADLESWRQSANTIAALSLKKERYQAGIELKRAISKAIAAAPTSPQAAEQAGEPVARGVYVASRASTPERPAMWRALRAAGWPILSSWIDEAAEGQTDSFAELWERIEREIRGSHGLIVYAEADDFPLKGAYIEAGIALGAGLSVAVVMPGVALEARSDRPMGSWIRHPRVSIHETLEQARGSLLGQESQASHLPVQGSQG